MEINITYVRPCPDVLSFAAGELKSYLGRMLIRCPGSLCVSLLVDSEMGPSVPESFEVELTPSGGTVRGCCGRAVLLASYDLLRRLGCRFLAPGRNHELVPEIDPGSLFLSYSHRASFPQRGVCIEGADSLENILDFIDWLPKAGFNSFFLQFKTPYIFLARWYQHRGNPTLTPEPYSTDMAVEHMRAAELELHRREILLHKAGHGWTGEVLGYEALTWDKAAPISEDKRPFAASLDGRRELYLDIPADTNLCLSNKAALQRFEELVVSFARQHPNIDFLHIWLADECNNVCECKKCRETTPSDQYVALLNRIARRMTREGLSTKLVFLLYQELLWPPVHERLEDPDRFVLMFAPISRSFGKSYELGATHPIPRYERNRITLPLDLNENLAFLRAWQEIFDGDSFIYDYPLGRAHYGDPGYVHISRVIYGDIKKLKKLGLYGYISCQELRAGLPNTLPNYVMGRTLLYRGSDIDDIISEYMAAAYGPACDIAGAVLRGLSDNELTDYINANGPRQSTKAAEKARRIVELCIKNEPEIRALAASSDSLRRGFLNSLSYHLRVAVLLYGSVEALALGDTDTSRRRSCALAQLIQENEREYQPWLDVYRLLEVTRKYTGLQYDD